MLKKMPTSIMKATMDGPQTRWLTVRLNCSSACKHLSIKTSRSSKSFLRYIYARICSVTFGFGSTDKTRSKPKQTAPRKGAVCFSIGFYSRYDINYFDCRAAFCPLNQLNKRFVKQVQIFVASIREAVAVFAYANALKAKLFI